MHDLIDQAIQLALVGNWPAAIDKNLEILQDNPSDIATLNRLARAYSEVGDKSRAQETYKAVLKLDKYNSIATRALRLLPLTRSSCQQLVQEDFIESLGLTRTIPLIKVSSRETLATLCTKQKITLATKGRLLAVTTIENQAIGCLPDDVSFKLQKLMTKGYEYSCCVKSVCDNAVTIFVREVKRPNRVGYTATFSASQTYSKLKK